MIRLALPPGRAGLRAWAVLAVLVIALQASFWWLSARVQQQPVPKSVLMELTVREVTVQPLATVAAPPILPPMAETAKAASLPRVPPEALRDRCVHGSSRPGERVHFERDLGAETAQPQALLVLFAADNVAAYLNGALLAPPRGRFDATPTRHGRQTWLLPLPAGLVRPGVNRFDLLVAHNGCLPIVTNVLVGDHATLARMHAQAVEVRENVPMLAVWLSLFVGLAALMLLPIADDRRLILSFGAMMVLLAGRSYYSLWNDWRFDQAGYAAVGAAISILNGASIASFAQVLAAPLRRAEGRIVLGITALHLAAILAAWLRGWTPVLTYIDAPFLLVAALYTGVRLLLWFRASPRAALWPLAIFSIYVGMTVWTQAYSWLMIPMTFNPRHLVPFYLAVGLGLVMLYRGYNLYRAAEAARASLAEQVAEKEQEIRASYLKLREQERLNTIQGERQRLIADMHDGVGGQLLGLLMLVRGRDYQPERLPQAVQAIIDDLRLIIDSMDSAGDTLGEALEAFRHRVLPRMRIRGLDIDWDDCLPDGLDGLRPQEILQVYRFLQEAIANVVRHAGAGRVRIALWCEDDALCLRVEDDGKGLGEGGGEGHGMASMRRRIGQLGGELDIAPADPHGLCLTARIPLRLGG